jgi:hypothetical protein
MSMGDLSIFWCLRFLSLMAYSFHCKGLTLPWLSLFLGILFIFWGYCKWSFFPTFSQIVHCFYIEKLLIFVYWFHIQILCWSCLLYLGVSWWSFLGLLGIRWCHLQIGIIWLLPFLFEFLLSLLPILFVWLEIPKLGNKSRESGHVCLIPAWL